MSVHLDDVQVCLPGRGCVLYVPGAGQALNAAIAIGPRVLDVFLAAVLGGLVLTAAVSVAAAVVTGLRGRGRRRDRELRGRATGTIAAGLLVAGGSLAAIPLLVPAVVPVAEVFTLCSSTCVGAGLLVMAGSVPHVFRVALTIAGGLRLLVLPVSVVQFLSAAPLGSFPSDVVATLADLMLTFAAVLLLVAGRGFGAVRWALLLPPFAAVLTGIRLGLPFAGDLWIDLTPDVAIVVTGLLVLTSRMDLASPAPGARRAAAQVGGAGAALALTLVVLLGWPTSVAGTRGVGEPVIGPVRVVTASTHLVLPLDSYEQSFVDRDVVIRAENALITVCAARQGVSTHAVDLLPAPTRDSNSSLLGLIDAQQAATIGYWSPPARESSGGVQSTRGLRVLTRCVSTARSRLGGDGSAPQLARELTYASIARTDADSRVRRLQAAWSRCMQLHGFSYPTPTAVAWAQSVAFPTPDDTRAASASVSCERVTNLPGVRAAVVAAYEKRAIAGHAEKLNSGGLAFSAQKRAATAILQRTPPGRGGVGVGQKGAFSG